MELYSELTVYCQEECLSEFGSFNGSATLKVKFGLKMCLCTLSPYIILFFFSSIFVAKIWYLYCEPLKLVLLCYIVWFIFYNVFRYMAWVLEDFPYTCYVRWEDCNFPFAIFLLITYDTSMLLLLNAWLFFFISVKGFVLLSHIKFV